MDAYPQYEFIPTFQGKLVVDFDFCHDGIYTLFVQFGEVDAGSMHEFVPAVLQVVLIDGVIHDPEKITLVVPDQELKFEKVVLIYIIPPSLLSKCRRERRSCKFSTEEELSMGSMYVETGLVGT